MARDLATLSGVPLNQLVLSNNRPNLASHTVMVPLWVDVPLTFEPHSRGAAITVLQFSDVDTIEGGAELIRAVRATLQHLVFMRCGYNQLETLLYLPTGEPLQYSNLRAIHGALTRDEDSRRFSVPEGAFPRLEYLHEVVECAWQYRMGVASHLLFNKLSEIVLPRLRAICLRTSRRMSLNYAHLPVLEHVTYYTRSEIPERLEGVEVCEQLVNLLRHPRLRFLRYYDQLPAVCLLSSLDIRCSGLAYLDIGLVTISFDNVEHILSALPRLCSFVFAISDRWSMIQPNRGEEILLPLSVSVQFLGMYVVAAAAAGELQHDDSTLTPSQMVMSRLPLLRKLCLQDGVDDARKFLGCMKQEQRFAWSQEVFDNVEIAAMDLFGRAT
ncbi:hypothetical protein GGI21_002512 [Coemansia aciculifera]|nr:hypothetical protein GGI21_002512 [Coemansia aciculifera]